eukprot:Pgem_evm1s1682
MKKYILLPHSIVLERNRIFASTTMTSMVPSPLNEWKKYYCESCNRTLNGLHEWE